MTRPPTLPGRDLNLGLLSLKERPLLTELKRPEGEIRPYPGRTMVPRKGEG